MRAINLSGDREHSRTAPRRAFDRLRIKSDAASGTAGISQR